MRSCHIKSRGRGGSEWRSGGGLRAERVTGGRRGVGGERENADGAERQRTDDKMGACRHFSARKELLAKKPPGIAAKPRFPPGNRAPRASLPSALRGRVDCPAGIRAQNSSRQHFLPASPRGKSQPSEKLAIITRRGLFSRGPKTSDACRQEYALGRCLAKTPEEEHKAITSPRIKIPLGKVRS